MCWSCTKRWHKSSILYIKATVLVCLSGQFLSTARTFVFLFFVFFCFVLFCFVFFFDGFCFMCQLNCPDLCFLFFFWDGFCFLCQLNCPDLCFFSFFDGFCFLCQLNCPDLCFVFFFWWVLFSVTVITRRVHYAPGSH
jgi:hypothetical protein